MVDTIVIHPHDSQISRVSWYPLGKNSSPLSPRGTGTLEEAAEKIKGWRLVAIFPASDLLLTKVTVPSKNKQRLVQAIPFTLENDLTEEIEQLHFAIDLHSDTGTTSVAIVSRQRLQAWLERFHSLDLQLLAAYPEPLCLPLKSGHWTVHLTKDQALLRTDMNMGFGSEIENFPTLFRMNLLQSGETPEQIDLYHTSDLDQESAVAFLTDLEINAAQFEYRDGTTAFLAENLDEKHTLNLLQGEYQQVDRKAVQWRRWIPTAILFTLLIGINIASSIIDYAHYKRQSVALNNEIHRVFRQAFPETKRIVDPKVQMEQQLRSLRGEHKESQGDFLTLIHQPIVILAKTEGIQLESINYRDNQLDLKLILRDLQTLEMIKKSIEDHDDLSVEIKSANASGSQVTSHLRVKRGST